MGTIVGLLLIVIAGLTVVAVLAVVMREQHTHEEHYIPGAKSETHAPVTSETPVTSEMPLPPEGAVMPSAMAGQPVPPPTMPEPTSAPSAGTSDTDATSTAD